MGRTKAVSPDWGGCEEHGSCAAVAADKPRGLPTPGSSCAPQRARNHRHDAVCIKITAVKP